MNSKTIQTIAFLGWLHHQHCIRTASLPTHKSKPMRPHLIVVPGSTLGNWCNELERFCPSLQVVVYHGSPKEKQHVKHILKRALINPPDSNRQRHRREPPVHVVLATYTMFERESGADDRSLLKKIDFDYLVLDGNHFLPRRCRFSFNWCS
jgi:SWI/SNF-related matrix-associated actin-dependent regulator of chromatin subfamily A containing DEAD/H box 1